MKRKSPWSACRSDRCSERGVFAALTAALLALGCSDGAPPESGCVRGQTIACACAGGRSGVQSCGENRAYGACVCGDADAATERDASPPDAATEYDASLPDAVKFDVFPFFDARGEDLLAIDAAEADGAEADRPPAPDVGFRCPPVTVGAAGGTVRCEGLTLTVPPGALTTAVPIQIIPTAEQAPSGYTAFSPIYRIEPAATTFARPVQLTMAFSGSGARASLFWSRPSGSTGYQRLGGIASGTAITASVTRLGNGFVADGVEYREAATRACTVTRLLEGRLVSSGISQDPSGIAMFFTAEDCEGRPLTDLTAADFEVRENGSPLSGEASVTLLNRVGPQVFVNLVLDMSSSTSAFLGQLITASRQFVTALQQSRNLPVRIGIQVFTGTPTLTPIQEPTLDTASLLMRLDSLATLTLPDRSSTNLYGAVIESLAQQAQVEAAFRRRNAGGAFTSGYVVLFTDGGDTAGLRTQMQAVAAVRESPARLIPVGLNGTDAMPEVLTALASRPGDVLTADDPTTLSRDFETLANRIALQSRTAYLLGYCSTRRAGMHNVSVGVRGGMTSPVATYGFSAGPAFGFCSPRIFTQACAPSDQCGGLGCGACDDRVSACTGRRCVSFCAGWNFSMGELSSRGDQQCGGVVINNPLGYSQRCDDAPESTRCGAQCRDLTTDLNNCGACGNACAQGARCDAGVCACPNGGTVCGGVCQELLRDRANCGACGNVCAQGASCVAGVCTCPMSGTVCSGTCRDLSTDRMNCGACGRPCAVECRAGSCVVVAEISVGARHTCARMSDGTVRCWGDNSQGQTAGSSTTASIPGLTGVAQISAGAAHTCARLNDGTVRCWGASWMTAGSSTTTSIPGLTGVAQISAGMGLQTCARLNDGTVRCWGSTTLGDLVGSAPMLIPGLTGVAEVSVGRYHSCARLNDGTVRCWGDNSQGQTAGSSTTASIPGLTDVAEVSAGASHTCARLNDGTVRCWGLSRMTAGSSTTTSIRSLSGVVEISAGDYYTCARLADGTVRCWGDNTYGETGGSSTMMPIRFLSGVVEISAGTFHTCARLNDGTVRCWGSNQAGAATGLPMGF